MQTKTKIILGSFIGLLIIVGSYFSKDISGNFAFNFNKDELIQQQAAKGKAILRVSSNTLESQALINMPDGISVSRSSNETASITPDAAKAVNTSKTATISQYQICVTGKTDALIAGLSFDIFGQAKTSFNATIDGQNILGGQKIFSSPFTNGSYQLTNQSYSSISQIKIPAGLCKTLNISGYEIFEKSNWMLPMFKSVTSTLPVQFKDTVDGKTTFTPINTYSKKTTFGYGTLFSIKDLNSPTQAGYSEIADYYSKILTEKIVVTRMTPKNYSLKQSDLALITDKSPIPLSVFNICVQGETDALLTGIKMKMYGNAKFNYYAGLDKQLLWQKPFEDFLTIPWTGTFFQKDSDFLFDTPLTMKPGTCKVFTTFTSSIQPGAKFILPIFENIGSNLYTEFKETEQGEPYTVPLKGKNYTGQVGYGTMLAMEAIKGPMYVQDQSSPDWVVDNYVNSYNTYYNIRSFAGQPEKIDTIQFILQTNYNKPVKAKVHFTRYFNSWQFGQDPNSRIVETNDLWLDVKPNTPVNLPVGMTVEYFNSLSVNVTLEIPQTSATYIMRMQKIVADGDVLIHQSPNFYVKNAKNFNGINGQKLIMNLPNVPQPGEVPLVDGSTSVTDPSLKCPKGKKCPAPDVINTYLPEEFDAVTKKMHGLMLNASIVYPNTFTSAGVKAKIAQNGFMNFANLNLSTVASGNDNYKLNAMSLTFKSNLDVPMKFKVVSGQNINANGVDMDIVANKPFTISPLSFAGYYSLQFNLTEYPSTIKNDFYIEPVLNSIDVSYIGTDGVEANYGVPIMEFDYQNSKNVLSKIPKSFGTGTFSNGGLYESKSNNIEPPYVEIVDMNTMTDTKMLTMNSFCMKSFENTKIQSFVFDHIVRDTSPFSAVTLEMNGSTAYLEKKGWSKHQAAFNLSTPTAIQGGQTICVDLKVKGPIAEQLENAYFDLMSLDAVDENGGVITMMLLNNIPLSLDNPLKGTMFNFL